VIFDAALFDSAIFDTGAVAADAPAAAVAGGRPRKRYLLPDDTLVWATPYEINEILEQFVQVEQPKPKTKKQKRKARHEPFVPIHIEFVPLPDFSTPTYRPELPPLMFWKPDLKAMKARAEMLRRRIDDEEAILLFL
jgi:hypothetical protein